jgi:hypothetical protein
MLLVQLANRTGVDSRQIDAPPLMGRYLPDLPASAEPCLKSVIQPLRHAGRLGPCPRPQLVEQRRSQTARNLLYPVTMGDARGHFVGADALR